MGNIAASRFLGIQGGVPSDGDVGVTVDVREGGDVCGKVVVVGGCKGEEVVCCCVEGKEM